MNAKAMKLKWFGEREREEEENGKRTRMRSSFSYSLYEVTGLFVLLIAVSLSLVARFSMQTNWNFSNKLPAQKHTTHIHSQIEGL